MLKLKRMMAVVLVLVMAVSIFAACGKSASSKADPASPAPDAGAEVSIDDTSEVAETSGEYKKFDDVTLDMLIVWNGGYKTSKEEGVEQYDNEVATAIREKIGVTLEFEGIMMSETEKLNLMFASGDMPDIINAPFWGGDGGETQVIKKAAKEGRLLPLEDELPKYANISDGYDLGIVSQVYLDRDLNDPGFEGHRYILPQEIAASEKEITNWAYGIFVRGDVPEALGIDETEVKTTEQLKDFMVKAKEHAFKDVNGNGTIIATTYHEGWDYGRYQGNFGGKTFTPYRYEEDGTTVTHGVLQQGWMDQNLFLWELVNEGFLDKECFKHSDAQADEKVGNGTALFAAAQYGVIINSTRLTGLYDSNPEMRYVPVGPLNYADGSPRTQLETFGRTGSPAIFFPTTCRDLDAALTLIDYVNSEEGARLVTYGIEGKTYEMNAQGQPRLNQELIDLKKSDEEAFGKHMRKYGALYMPGRLTVASKNMERWGETGVGVADAAVKEIEDYKLLSPIERVDGYRADGFASEYENYEPLKKFLLEGTTEKDYRERAYFAETREEAQQILQDYRDYISTQEDGMLADFLKFMTDEAAARGDVIM